MRSKKTVASRSANLLVVCGAGSNPAIDVAKLAGARRPLENLIPRASAGLPCAAWTSAACSPTPLTANHETHDVSGNISGISAWGDDVPKSTGAPRNLASVLKVIQPLRSGRLMKEYLDIFRPT